jgi:hypothetical protein
MSFGFSFGDCILLIDIAFTEYHNCKAADPEYRELDEVFADIKASYFIALLSKEKSTEQG